MSICAVIRTSSNNKANVHPQVMRSEDIAIWEGIRSGNFRAETIRTADCGTVISLITEDQRVAHTQLSQISFVANGDVKVDLGELPEDISTRRII